MSRLLRNRRKTCSGDGLSVPFLFFVGDVNTNAFGNIGELVLENVLSGRQNQVAPFARHHSSENQQISKIVEVGVMRDAVAEKNTDGLVDLARARIAGGH